MLAAVEAEAVHESVVGGLGGVGDEGKDGLVKIVADGGDDLIDECGAHGLALAVDLRIVSAGKINFLERAGGECLGGVKLGVGDRPIGFDRDDGAGINGFYVGGLGFKDGHEWHPFGGEGDDFVGDEHVAGTDAAGIAHDEHVAVADGATDRVAAVPGAGGLGDEIRDVQCGGNVVGDFRSGDALIAELVVEIGVGLVEVVADLLEDRLGIGAEDRMLAALDEGVVQIDSVGHVEISHDHEGAGGPVAAAEVRVAGAFIELPAGAVAEVADQDLTAEIEVIFNALRVAFVHHALAIHLKIGFHFFSEDLGECVGFDSPAAMDVGSSHGHVELHAANPGAVLAAVVLFFHEEEKLVQAPEAGAVAIIVVGQGLSQSHGGDSTFVLQGVAHAGKYRGDKLCSVRLRPALSLELPVPQPFSQELFHLGLRRELFPHRPHPRWRPSRCPC